ncbi:hypothetical protein [Aegicerativicinus sediminis]|uniref:hypothetical protein n=1 Tax=Aegicerativicinus sediminis TaxID=2893202 RepID=UPI001E311053|nr:hypothetical protein [Aegicerativicinus sediminis]
MKKFLVLALILPILMFSQEEDGPILTVYQFTIKEGHQKKFYDGMEKWKKCYVDNGGKNEWNVWNRLQGKGNAVGISFFNDNWAAFDENSEPQISEKCDPIVFAEIMPAIESSETTISRLLPRWTRETPTNHPVLWITYFDVDNGADFRSVVNDVNSVYRKHAKDRMGTWFNVIGGEGPDYFVVSTFENFAAMDEDNDGPWDFYAKEHGEAKMNEMRNKFRNSLEKSWSYIYRRNDNLSHNNN